MRFFAFHVYLCSYLNGVNSTNKLKIFNDPIYGFISIPNSLVFDLIQHPYFQRLRRISQMGLSYLVYPGAHHTRFHHALGCMHIMQKALETLKYKGVQFTEEEENALYIAILLHDIGHGPFSHAMEHSIVEGIQHEEISLQFMHALNRHFNGQLDLAIQIFKGDYHRKFMLELISSQLDMDRMDYLKRDSFYSGVAEGNINSDRLIQMMNVADDHLVIEEKGVYSVEKFLMARRLMYWQAYLHKTSVVAELILTKILKRAKELTQKGNVLPCSPPLQFFLQNKVARTDFDGEALTQFALLDDYDVMGAIKLWQFSTDFVLAELCKMIVNRELLKIDMSEEKPVASKIQTLKAQLLDHYPISANDSDYFVFKGKLKNIAYNKESVPIRIIKKDRSVEVLEDTSEPLQVRALSKAVTKYFVCYPKVLLG